MDDRKTSRPIWTTQLRRTLSRSLPDAAPRVALVGVGQELRGDDAAGVVVVRRLATNTSSPDALIIIDAGPAPENVLGKIVRFGPEVVIFIDAADLGRPAGTVQWITETEIGENLASTHTPSLGLAAAFLRRECGCRVYVIGIQPESDAFDAPLSAPVAAAVDNIAAELLNALLP